MSQIDPNASTAPEPESRPVVSPSRPAPPAESASKPEAAPLSGPTPRPESAPPPSTESLEAEVQRELSEALGDADIGRLMEEAAQAADAVAKPADPHVAAQSQRADGPQRFELDIRRGRIAAISGEDVFIEVAGVDGKNQGVVPLTQFERAPRVGSIMDFVVEREDDAGGLLILSREGAVGRATWDHLHRGALVEGRVVSSNKGGLELELVGRIRAFMPASQIDLHRVDDMEALVGQKLHGQVQEIDRRKKSVVISRRAYLIHEREVLARKLWDELQVGDEREGTVARLMPFGAFVDLGGIDGMVHVSDMSYSHVDKPEAVLTVGQKVKVKILKIDREKDRIGLGMKQVTPDPWASIADRVRAGDELSGRVVRTADFGAFIEVEPGVEGLLPISEISWGRTNKVTDQVKEGDVIRLRVLQVDADKRRVSLSLRQSQGDPWVGAAHKYASGSMIEATVISTPEFGAFVELEPGVEGMVHISELSDRRVDKVTDILKAGDRREFRVLNVDEDGRRIKLSLKPAPQAQLAPPAAGQSAKSQPPPPGKAKAPSHHGKPLKGGMDKHGGLGTGLKDLKL